MPVASSGIAALLLDGGRTAHSRFKIPLEPLETSTGSIPVQSQLADLIRRMELSIWDEAPMQRKQIYEAVDRTFRDIMATNGTADDALPALGGKVVVFGGNWRQTLPVIPKAGREEIVASCLRRSGRIWPHVTTLKLSVNMRLQQGGAVTGAALARERNYAKFLLDVGDGTIPKVIPGKDIIRLPAKMVLPPTNGLERLINFVYPNLASHDPTASEHNNSYSMSQEGQSSLAAMTACTPSMIAS